MSQCVAMFQSDETKLRDLMDKLPKLQDARLHLDAEIAERLGQIRELIILAEDSRLHELLSDFFNVSINLLIMRIYKKCQHLCDN